MQPAKVLSAYLNSKSKLLNSKILVCLIVDCGRSIRSGKIRNFIINNNSPGCFACMRTHCRVSSAFESVVKKRACGLQYILDQLMFSNLEVRLKNLGIVDTYLNTKDMAASAPYPSTVAFTKCCFCGCRIP